MTFVIYDTLPWYPHSVSYYFFVYRLLCNMQWILWNVCFVFCFSCCGLCSVLCVIDCNRLLNCNMRCPLNYRFTVVNVLILNSNLICLFTCFVCLKIIYIYILFLRLRIPCIYNIGCDIMKFTLSVFVDTWRCVITFN